MTNGKAEKNNKKTLGLVVLLFVLVIVSRFFTIM